MSDVAVCVAGLTDDLEDYWPNIYENIIQPNSADVFVHTWDNQPWFTQPRRLLVEDNKEVLRRHQRLINRSKEYSANVERMTERVISKWYSIFQANKAKTLYKKYKYTVVVRSQVTFEEPLLIKGGLNIPNGMDYGGVNDNLVYGDTDSVDYYCSLYLMMRMYTTHYVSFHAESLLRYHLVHQGKLPWRTKYKMYLRGELWGGYEDREYEDRIRL